MKRARRVGRPRKFKKRVSRKSKGKKLGRPRKCRGVQEACTESCDVSNVKKFKFLGYCKCENLISTKELVSKFIFECPVCGKRSRISKLQKELKRDRPSSKKEYLDSTIHANHIETLPLNSEVDLKPSELKVQE